MNRTSKILAGVLGIGVLILVILAARWTGQMIQKRFLIPKPVPVVTKQAPVIPEENSNLLAGQTPTATRTPVTVIPETGPEESIYVILLAILISGFFLLDRVKNLSYKYGE